MPLTCNIANFNLTNKISISVCSFQRSDHNLRRIIVTDIIFQKMKGSAKIVYSNIQSNCFSVISWPVSFESSPTNLKVLAIQTENGGTHYLSVSSSAPGRTSKSGENLANVIKINGKYARALNIRDGEQVVFWEMKDTAVASVVTYAEVSCCSRDDWEILETNAEYVSTHLLNQLRVVYPGQAFPFWLSKSMVILLKIDKINPALDYGVLATNSEIIIPSLSSARKYILPKKLQKHQKLRIHPFLISPSHNLLPSEALLFCNKFHGFAYRSHFETNIPESQEYIFVSLLGSSENVTQLDSTNSTTCSTIKLFFLDSIKSFLVKEVAPFTNIPCVYLHCELLQSTKLETKSWAWIHAEPETAASSLPTHCAVSRQIEAFPSDETDFCGFEHVMNECLNFVSSSLSLSEQPFENNLCGPEFGSLFIHGSPGSGKTSLVNAIINALSLSPYFIHHENVSCAKLRGKKPESMEKELLKRIHMLEEKQPSVLILDDVDVLVAAPKSEPSQQEEFLQFKISETLLDLVMKLKNQRIAVICTALSKSSVNGYWKSRPGFHFFQKYIKLPTTSKSERLEIFTTCLKRYLNKSGCEDLRRIKQIEHVKKFTKSSSYNSEIAHNIDYKNTKGTLLSKTGALQDKAISDAVHDLCSISGSDDELTKQIALALDSIHEQNATPQFLVNVAKKWGAYLQSHQDYEPTSRVAAGGHVSSSVGGYAACGINDIKTNEDVNERMKAFNEILQEEIRFSADLNEMSKRKYPLQEINKLKISWDSIGGLNGVKQELTKILDWPIKFPQFFKNAPVRLPCGILFYGYPGTGKSIMGLAIQTIVNVKFIHVKGPELLSKYIGASEQAVQDVFNRARESSPCILFFDEFDSLVPRRGHDFSGVTDRVVNQFLSEMDGIDGGLGEGVYLIAATSRPDLIDPAVLRPGRLDKHLFFDFPSKQERKEIIATMSSQVGLKLENESDWSEICTLTEGFTGADLNALMFTAQLSVVHEHLSKLDNDGAKLGGQSTSSISTAATTATHVQEIQVTKESLLAALKDFKPSVQGQEYRKFKAIYHDFAASKTGKNGGAKELFQTAGTKMEEEVDKQWKMQPGKRATLA